MQRSVYFVLGCLVIILSVFLAFWGLDQVDLEASENIYVADAIGYLRRDPYMAPRQHLGKPHAPASPHPFLVQFLTAEIFKYFGLSLFTARLLQSGSVVMSALVVMFLARRIFKTASVAIVSGLVYTTFPLVVRYSRMAVLDPILALVQGLGAVWLWELIQSTGKMVYLYAFFVGMSVGLSLSIKLTGIFYVLFVAIGLFWYKFKLRPQNFFRVFLIIILTGVLVFYLFNDPASYIFAWTHFSDPRHKSISLISMIKGLVAVDYWLPFAVTLIGIVPVLLLLSSLPNLVHGRKSASIIFIAAWMMASIYLVINPAHITGLSSEWAYLPIMLPLALIVGKLLWTFGRRLRFLRYNQIIFLLMGIYLLLATPTLVFFGLRYASLPLPNLAHGRNAVMGDLSVMRIIKTLNQDSQPSLVLVKLKGIELPLWLLNNNIITEPFYHELSAYDYVVTDDMKLITQTKANNFITKVAAKNQTEPEVFLLYQRKID